MALTNCLAQSLIGIALFYGIGVGIGPEYGMAAILLAWMVLTLPIAWSRGWLERFRYGPIEWPWRWLMYGERPRFLRGTRTAVACWWRPNRVFSRLFRA